MKVKDEAEWLKQKAELAQQDDPENGELFLKILDEWTTLAERWWDQYWGDGIAGDSPLKALRETLPRVEQNHGALSGLWIFEMILVMETHWVHGDGLYEALTPFERAALGDVARAIMRDAQQAAQTVPSGPEN